MHACVTYTDHCFASIEQGMTTPGPLRQRRLMPFLIDFLHQCVAYFECEAPLCGIWQNRLDDTFVLFFADRAC